jgi:hypothetical protein
MGGGVRAAKAFCRGAGERGGAGEKRGLQVIG